MIACMFCFKVESILTTQQANSNSLDLQLFDTSRTKTKSRTVHPTGIVSTTITIAHQCKAWTAAVGRLGPGCSHNLPSKTRFQ